MSLYTQFGTDSNLETSGILLQYGQNSQGKDICIRIARAGGNNKQYQKRMETLIKPYRRQIQNETLDNDIADKITKEVYAQTVVLGWENVEDENGEELEFSVANCIKLFTDLPELWSDIQQQDTRASLFRAEILENDSKNQLRS